MRRLGQSTTVVLVATLAAIAPTSAANAGSSSPPSGTTYWVNSGGDLLVMKRDGRRLRIGNPLTPCYTGIHRSDGSYEGGGMGQNGFYVRQRLRLKFQPGFQAVKVPAFSNYWYTQFTRRAALRQAVPRPRSVPALFQDCELR